MLSPFSSRGSALGAGGRQQGLGPRAACRVERGGGVEAECEVVTSLSFRTLVSHWSSFFSTSVVMGVQGLGLGGQGSGSPRLEGS